MPRRPWRYHIVIHGEADKPPSYRALATSNMSDINTISRSGLHVRNPRSPEQSSGLDRETIFRARVQHCNER